ncbi:glycoside hydrolase family 95-like protein [Streptomyces edwardsiae]|uniref:glycoside hydrolase family 95-like protein n=1 Tax=Streptomyces edwardsiae TaxID=3075527 RepID=UPI0034D9737E
MTSVTRYESALGGHGHTPSLFLRGWRPRPPSPGPRPASVSRTPRGGAACEATAAEWRCPLRPRTRQCRPRWCRRRAGDAPTPRPGVIELLPALRGAWAGKSSVTWLGGRGGCVVNRSWREGKVTSPAIRSAGATTTELRPAHGSASDPGSR